MTSSKKQAKILTQQKIPMHIIFYTKLKDIFIQKKQIRKKNKRCLEKAMMKNLLPFY